MRPLSRLALAPLLASSLLLAACTPKHWARDGSDNNKKANPRDNNQIEPDSDKQIDDILRGAGSAPSGKPRKPPQAPPPGGDRDDTFPEDVAKIRRLVPTWDNGTGIAVRFLKEATGKRLSLIYVDPTPPEYKPGKGWLIQGIAKASNEVVGHYLILLKDVAPGRYEGSPDKADVVMASLIDPTWKGDSPRAAWSINEGSSCDVTLRPGQKPGHLEGEFHARLVTNDGTSFITVENGYLYINPDTEMSGPQRTAGAVWRTAANVARCIIARASSDSAPGRGDGSVRYSGHASVRSLAGGRLALCRGGVRCRGFHHRGAGQGRDAAR